MRIRNNLNALNSWRHLAASEQQQERSIGRLASGRRINSAADDASGLGIAERMRSLIKGISQAERNAQDGISLVQTADLSLSEVQTILGRIRESAVAAGNGSLSFENRMHIQREVDEMAAEITRIVNTQEFNGVILLDGALQANTQGELSIQVGALAEEKININMGAMDAASLGVARDYLEGTVDAPTVITTVDEIGPGLQAGSYTISYNAPVVQLLDESGTAIGPTWEAEAGDTLTLGHKDEAQTVTVTMADPLPDGGGADSLVVQAVSGKEAQPAVFAGEVKVSAAQAAAGLNVSSLASRNNTIVALDIAINMVSQQRSQLGALQNRLEHATASLQNTNINLVTAESRIRDLDVANEVMSLAKYQMKAEAGTAMLAQANAKPQAVLSLLKQ